MLNSKPNSWFALVIVLGGALAGGLVLGCGSQPQSTAASSPATQPASFALFGPPPVKSGVQMWSENCARCHNLRPPEEFSNAQWAAIVHHMRLRANLTGPEAEEILKVLQASN